MIMHTHTAKESDECTHLWLSISLALIENFNENNFPSQKPQSNEILKMITTQQQRKHQEAKKAYYSS